MKLALTDRVVRMIDKADRQKLGLKTFDEIAAQAVIKSERDLHRQVANLLRLRGIEFFESRMDRRTTRPKGEPDFLFAVLTQAKDKMQPQADLRGSAIPCAWELKLPGRSLDPEQAKMFGVESRRIFWRCGFILRGE